MKHKLLLTALAVVLMVAGCNRETPQEPVVSPEEDVDAMIQSLEQFSANPASGLAKVSGGKRIVEVPAGSNDALAAAIAEVRDGGVVLLRAGNHTESGTVTVDHRVIILGEPGAVLISDTKPLATVQPALHVLNASRTVVWGVEFHAKEAVGGTGILVENSTNTLIGSNKMYELQYGVLVEKGDRATIHGNTVVTTSAWQTGQLAAVYGIVIINGDEVRVSNNNVSNAFFGIWVCDQKGTAHNNSMSGNYVGLILCKVAEFDFTLPNGNAAPAEQSATKWHVEGNNSTGNFDAGYLVIDGANNNTLESNNASSNGTYDFDLTGDTYRFGFLTPKSFNNKFNAGQFQNVTIKNCGDNNTIVGGQLVDNSQDPCK